MATLIGPVRVLATIVAFGISCAGQDAPPPSKPKPNIVVSGCLMRQGYATFVLADANVDATGEEAAKATPRNEKSGDRDTPRRWVLDNAGVAGPHVGEKVQVVGVSDWVEASQRGAHESRDDQPPPATPHIDVQTMKVIAKTCS